MRAGAAWRAVAARGVPRRHRQAAAQAAQRIGVIAPYRIPPPYELRIEYLPGHGIGDLLVHGGVVVGERAVLFRADRMAHLPGIS